MSCYTFVEWPHSLLESLAPLANPVKRPYLAFSGGVFLRQILLIAGGYSLVWLLRNAGASSPPLWLLIAGLIVFDSAMAGLDWLLGMLFVSRVSLPLFRNVRVASLRKALDMSVEQRHDHHDLELVSKLNIGAGKVVQTAEMFAREVAPALIRTTLSLAPLLWFSPWTTPIVLASLIAFLCLTQRENRLRHPYRELRHEQYARDAGLFTECVQNSQVLTQFGQTARMTSRYEALQQRIIDEGVNEIEIANRYLAARGVIVAVTRRICQLIWLWQFQQNRLDGPMVMYLSLLTDELIGSFGTYAGVLERIYDGVEPARTLSNLLLEPGESDLPDSSAIRKTSAPVAIDLDQVSFSYRFGPPVLRDVTLNIAPGEIIGIVGTTGAGKTTLQHLLSRILEPRSGSIRVAGVDIRDWKRHQLRSLFTTLGQNGAVVFSHQTILETIRFARPAATDAEVHSATRVAAIDQDISRLPNGYHTLLGPGGVRLSKGQLQRLGLAQVVLALKDRPIVILDEFTSALDSRTEQTVIDNLRPLLQGKTVVIVAHRLATLRKLADRVVVLERGCIVEQGSHRELVTRNTRYAELARLQSVS